MDVTELSREQLVELKQNYLCSLADSGDYSEVFDVNYIGVSYFSKVIIVCLTWRFVKRVITLKQLDIIILHLKMERMILIAKP